MDTSALPVLFVDSLPRDKDSVTTTGGGGLPIAAMTSGMRRGDTAAWNEFHRTYYLRLLRYASSRGASSEADGAVQAAYLRVARHVHAFDHESDLWHWLCCIVRCVVIDLQREQVRTSRLRERFQLWAEQWRSRGEPSPHDELADALEAALHILDDADSQLLRCKYCEGWSTADLAKAHDCSAKAVEHRLARLRAKLKEQLTGGNFHA